MPRSRFWIICLLVIMMSGGAWVVADESEDQMCVPMGAITLEPPASVEAKRSVVEFPHAVHFTYACNTCHHTWEGVEQIKGCMTSGCHDMAVSPLKKEIPDDDKAPVDRYYKQAYHKLCIGCHKDLNIKREKQEANLLSNEKIAKAGPTSCMVCHSEE